MINLDFLSKTEQKAVKTRISFWIEKHRGNAQARFDRQAEEIYDTLLQEVGM
jgi:hypothetical protein